MLRFIEHLNFSFSPGNVFTIAKYFFLTFLYVKAFGSGYKHTHYLHFIAIKWLIININAYVPAVSAYKQGGQALSGLISALISLSICHLPILIASC